MLVKDSSLLNICVHLLKLMSHVLKPFLYSGFGSRLMLKDLGLATDMAANTESNVPLG